MIEQLYRNMILPGFERLVKGRSTFRLLRELEASQWWSLERLEHLQLERLRRLLQRCMTHCEYYRELWPKLGLSVDSLHSLRDFHRWPIVERETMRDQAEQIRSTQANLRWVTKATGGSSGTPLRFVIDEQANTARMAAAYRGYGWAGAQPGTKQIHLWGVPLQPRTRARRWKDYLYARGLHRLEILNCFELNEETIPRYVRRINASQPTVMVAYTSPLVMLAREIQDRHLHVFQPRAIVVGAEKLHDFQRELIEDVFRAPVFETYGSREFTLIGAECEYHAGLHLTMENLLVEVVDPFGMPTPAGEEGDVVVTDLWNIAMPFVRYAIGDRAIAGLVACRCGRGLPLLQKVTGRRLDVLKTVDGRHLAGEFFPHLLKDYRAIRQFQVVQSVRDRIDIKLVVDHHWSSAQRAELQTVVQQKVGTATQVNIWEVDNIELTPAGKHRVVVSQA